jgi:WD40 repeat protein
MIRRCGSLMLPLANAATRCSAMRWASQPASSRVLQVLMLLAVGSMVASRRVHGPLWSYLPANSLAFQHFHFRQMWDLDAGRCTASRTCEPDSVPMCIAAAPDVGPAVVVTGHADGSLSVWDPRCGDAAISCSEPRVRFVPRENRVSSTGSASGIISVDVCPGRPNDVLSCSSDSSLCIIDLRTLSRSRRLVGDAFHLGTGTTARASLSPDGCWACAGGAAGTLNLWPLQTASEAALVLRGHAAGVLATTWGAYPEGGLLASTDRGGAILVWAASDATDADCA